MGWGGVHDTHLLKKVHSSYMVAKYTHATLDDPSILSFQGHL